MKDLVVDVDGVIANVSLLQNSLDGIAVDVKCMTSSDDESACKTIMSLTMSGNYRRFALLVKPNSKLKRTFPNNIVEVNGAEDYASRFQKIVNSIEWILNGNKKERDLEDNAWLIADTHFSHGNIIKYCDRPWKSGAKDCDGKFIVTESDVHDMNEAIIANWNSKVAPNDVVWHLGDFALGDRSLIPSFVSRLNGKKRIILGNHDYFNVDKSKYKDVVDFFYQAGFERVYDHPVLLDDFIVLSHEPLSFVKSPCFNAYGHVHANKIFRTYSEDGCCVCVERHNYTPISWEEICKKCMSSE